MPTGRQCYRLHRCKKRFLRFCYYFSKKRVFKVLYFLNVFYLFYSGNFVCLTKPGKILLNLRNSEIKRLLGYGLNMAAIKNSLIKSRSPQTLSCIIAY